ncbi:MAG: DegQ family serine endoprotease [Rhizomicrobium sp.]|nr:DegQ family serine endoprotease [Rhizomicrobium sp.]
MAYMKRNKALLAGTAVAAIIGVSFGAYAILPDHPGDPAAVRYDVADRNSAAPARMMENGTPFSFADLVERVSPAVVSVTAEEVDKGGAQPDLEDMPEAFKDLFRQFGGRPQMRPQPQPRKATSMGSGFIIDKSGLIVTNNHVVDGASKITVKLPDGRSFTAKLIGTDASTDVALLKITADKPLPIVEFGNDRTLRVGDWVVAVGNPFGLSNTVTAGIVSSIGRDIGNSEQPYTDFIQIDAPINKGNSGGPTFDLKGQVIGMNSMIFSPSGGSVGIGFAIPASTIKDVVAALQSHGRVARGWLGVQIQPVTPEIATSLNLKEPKGALVASLVPDSPAARAGVRQGDVILAINGAEINDAHDLTRRVASLPAGKAAAFAILRDGGHQNLSVTIGAKKDTVVAANTGAPEGGPANFAVTGKAMGLGLTALSPEVRRAYNLDESVQGVVVTKVDPESDAAEQGLQPGDVVVSVHNKAVHSPQDVEKSVAQAHSAGLKSVLLLVSSGGTAHFVAVPITKT